MAKIGQHCQALADPESGKTWPTAVLGVNSYCPLIAVAYISMIRRRAVKVGVRLRSRETFS